jgi:hypothetical protein
MKNLFTDGYSPLDFSIFGEGDDLFRHVDGTIDLSKYKKATIKRVPLQEHDGSEVRFFVTHSPTHHVISAHRSFISLPSPLIAYCPDLCFVPSFSFLAPQQLSRETWMLKFKVASYATYIQKCKDDQDQPFAMVSLIMYESSTIFFDH